MISIHHFWIAQHVSRLFTGGKVVIHVENCVFFCFVFFLVWAYLAFKVSMLLAHVVIKSFFLYKWPKIHVLNGKDPDKAAHRQLCLSKRADYNGLFQKTQSTTCLHGTIGLWFRTLYLWMQEDSWIQISIGVSVSYNVCIGHFVLFCTLRVNVNEVTQAEVLIFCENYLVRFISGPSKPNSWAHLNPVQSSEGSANRRKQLMSLYSY